VKPAKTNPESDANRLSPLEKTARLCFAVYFFFILFGTSLPFQEKIKDANEIATSNAINQVVFSIVFVVSSICLASKWKNLILIIKKEKFLTLFLLWSLLSVLWSPYGFVAFKRWFQILTTFTVSLALLLSVDTPGRALTYFKALFSLYLPLTVFSVLVIPGALDPDFGTWRGLAPTKNLLGQVALVSILTWFYALRTAGGKGKKISFLMLAISVMLLLGAQSMTAMLAFVALAGLAALSFVDMTLKPLAVGKTFSVIALLAGAAVVFSTVCFAPELVDAVPDYFGKDDTFSGRTELWADIFEETEKHWLFGCGFASFWVVGNPPLEELYKEYVWLPNEAHLGYLDILNETGLVGLLLFIAMVAVYFKRLGNVAKPHFWKWFVFCALIVNLQESTLFKHNLLTGVMFIFSYLAFYIELTEEANS
jgi:O-antigen ligase